MAFIVKKQANLKFKKNTTFKIPRIPFLPSSLGGLSLWLKADAGVTVATSGPYTYVSQIVITGSNTPNVNGTYTATSVPTFDYLGNPNNYVLAGPTFGMEWVNGNNYFYLQTGGFNEYWTSSDGVNWEIGESITDTITISGSTTPDVNGVYTRPVDENVFYGPTYVIENYGNFQLLDQGEGITYYTASSATGPWTIVDGSGAITSTSTLVPRGSITATKVVSSSVVTAWADQSDNGNNATSNDPTYKPLFNASDLNSKPTISLTSMNDYIERVFSISINPLGVAGSTAFSVQYVEDVCGESNDNGPIFGNFGGSEDSASLSQTHYPYGPDCFVYDAFGTRSRKNGITPPVTITNAWTLYSVKSTDDDWQSFVNGQLMYSDPTNTYSSAIGGDDTTLYIGKQTANGTYSLKGKVAEVIVYNRVLTTEERQQVEAYLNSKYQIY